MKRTVVITGLGIIAPSGIGKDEFWRNTVSGKSCVADITRFSATKHKTRIAAEITGFDARDYVEESQIRRSDLSTHYAVAAAKLATEDSGLVLANEDPDRVGVTVGIACGGIGYIEDQCEKYFRKKNLSEISAFLTLGYFSCAPLGQISIQLGLCGYSNSITTGCTAGTVAIGDAYLAIKRGAADVMLAGGTDAPVTPLTLQAFSAMKALSTYNKDPQQASRPFDKHRDGFVLSEGAAFVVMEEKQHAVQRGARIYAEVCGYGVTSNGFHMTAPLPDGTQSARAMLLAMDEAGVNPIEVGYLNCHGSSTPLNEKAETLAIKKAFGEHAYKLPISSLKSMIGHALGGAGAMQAVANCLVIERGIIPPTINYEVPDPDCDLDYVPNTARIKTVDIALQNSAGFSGVNATLLLRRNRI